MTHSRAPRNRPQRQTVVDASNSGTVKTHRYDSGVQVLWSETASTSELCQSLVEQTRIADIALAIIWFSPTRHAATDIVSTLAQRVPELAFCGCSTSGELTPDGMQEYGFVITLLPARWFTVHTTVMEDIATQGMENIAKISADARTRFMLSLDALDDSHSLFAMNLIDGLSYSEERITVAIDRGLGGIPLIGGSAGDDLQFEATWQISNQCVLQKAAVLTLIHCRLPCQIFTNNNFVPTEHKLVVTEANPELRRVSEFNAEPAAVAYANAIGKSIDELDAGSFASYSVIVRFGGRYYCRSIQRLNEDMSLTFFCAIDNGLVLTVARSEGMVASSRRAIEAIETEIGPIDIIIGFDCISRKLDARNRQTTHRIASLYREKNFVGFNAYGEQHNSLHDNQTITGVAIGTPVTPTEN